MLASPLTLLEFTCSVRAADRQIIFITLIFRACVVAAILCMRSVCTLRTELLNVKDMNKLKLMD